MCSLDLLYLGNRYGAQRKEVGALARELDNVSILHGVS